MASHFITFIYQCLCLFSAFAPSSPCPLSATPAVCSSTNEDEMCNFYIMYWTAKEPLSQKSCFSLGPPFYYWTRGGLGNIPDKDASSLPVGTSAKETGVAPHQI